MKYRYIEKHKIKMVHQTDKQLLESLEDTIAHREFPKTFDPRHADYLKSLAKAMRWWIESGYSGLGALPPGSNSTKHRDRILLEWARVHRFDRLEIHRLITWNEQRLSATPS